MGSEVHQDVVELAEALAAGGALEDLVDAPSLLVDRVQLGIAVFFSNCSLRLELFSTLLRWHLLRSVSELTYRHLARL